MTKLIRIKGLDIVFIRYLQLKRAKPKKRKQKGEGYYPVSFVLMHKLIIQQIRIEWLSEGVNVRSIR